MPANWNAALAAEADRLLAATPGKVFDTLSREFESTLIRRALNATGGRRVDAAQLLGITLPTLRDYTRRGLVEGYRIGTRVRYKRSEVLGSLQRIRTPKPQRA